MIFKLSLKPLSDLLQEVYNAPPGDIYLQGSYPWNKDSLGILFYTDGFGEPLLRPENPEWLQENNLQRVMQIGRAEDAMSNAFAQKEDISIDEAVACFNFHYANDGYLDLSESQSD